MKKILIILMFVAGIFGSTCAIDMFFNDGELINIMAQSEIVQKDEEDEPTHIHEYSEWELTKPVKCDESGQEERYCSCGQKQTRALSSTGHSYGEWSLSKKPTCEENGTEDRFCQCGSKQSKLIAAIGHSYGEYSVTRFATCEEDGEEASVCQCGLKNTRPIEASGHSYGEYTVIRNVTCTEDGIEEGVCHCGAKNTKITPSSGHTFGEFSVTKKATCTEAGTEERSCHCGEIQSRAVGATGHTEKITSTVKPATCKEKGLRQTKCKACDEVINSETLPITEHVYNDYMVTKPATCTVDGVKEKKCNGCGDILESKVVPATGHKYMTSYVSAGCDTPGGKSFTCERCSDSYLQKDSEPIGHELQISGICRKCDKDMSTDMTKIISAPLEYESGTSRFYFNAGGYIYWTAKNISSKIIRSVSIELEWYDAFGKALGKKTYSTEGVFYPNDEISCSTDGNLYFSISKSTRKASVLNIKVEYADGSVECGPYGHSTYGLGGKYTSYYADPADDDYFVFSGTNRVMYYDGNGKVYEGTYTIVLDTIIMSFSTPGCPYQGTFRYEFSEYSYTKLKFFKL